MKETKINKNYQTTIPEEIRNIFNISTDDTLIWEINEDEITIKIKKQKQLKNKTLSFVDDEEIDSIKIEKEN